MIKEQLTAFVRDRLNGGVTNSDNMRKFHPIDVEISIGQVIADVINASEAQSFTEGYLKRYKVSLDKNFRGEIPVAYIPRANGFHVAFAEDISRNMYVYPRKGAQARAVMNNLEASRSISTLTVHRQEIVFDLTNSDCREFYVYLYPQYTELEDEDDIFLPPGFEATIADKVMEREFPKLNIPIDNTNDAV